MTEALQGVVCELASNSRTHLSGAVMLRPVSALRLFALLLLLSTSSAVQNNATESISPQPALDTQDPKAHEYSNQARNRGRRPTDAVRDGLDQSQVSCRELRSTKYISDGQCTSVNPIKELVCAGECLPAHLMPNWIGGTNTGRYWSRRDAQEWRCVIDRTRSQRIQLQCHDGSTRTYKITVVTSCKCKRYNRQQNNSELKDTPAHSGKPRKDQGKAGLLEMNAERQSAN
ncbi:sclerostin domain-containing protein 1-like [Archocentrus centrarchus]|uniref:sclerostin domain-containing protein 1-like n=1 Tax=Archocentrus centrarchus TaxID=63155 RepID=UPI0011E9F727|nr:sclerostin domain-containing protein 1-like [Archocentrus centrarchus]